MALRTADDVKTWLESKSPIGIHQFGVDANGYPHITAGFVTAAFAELSKTKLERGKNIPARICVVFEEAHSLIPEWNQVANKGDEQHVNKTARVILQGRKYGMGALIITQRTANVTKTILNQCNTVFALRSFDQTGLDFLRNYMGEEYSQAISTLPRYTAVLVGQASSSSRPIILKVSDFSSRAEEPAKPEQEPSEPPKPVTAE
jgi:DNA helicase HerA-like ATPase